MVQQTLYKGTEYKYIIGSNYVIFSNGVLFTLDEYKKYHREGKIPFKLRTLLRVPERLFNYDIACETGVLQPVYIPIKTNTPAATALKRPRKPREKKAKVENPVVEAEVVNEVIDVTPEVIVKAPGGFRMPKFKKEHFNKTNIIFYVMLFVAAGSATMSIYHAFAFLYNGGKPFFISCMTAMLIVTFASTGFTAARYFLERKGIAKLFSLPFVLITMVLICYIAFSTTSVSYTQFRDMEASTTMEVRKEIAALEISSEVSKQAAETERYIKQLTNDISFLRRQEDTQREIIIKQKALDRERGKLAELRAKVISAKEAAGGGSIEEKKESITSVYDFFSKVFGFNSVSLRFLVYVIPAVFYDVVAPFGFTVVFLLIDKKEPEEIPSMQEA